MPLLGGICNTNLATARSNAFPCKDLCSVVSTPKATFTSRVDADNVGDVMHGLLDV